MARAPSSAHSWSSSVAASALLIFAAGALSLGCIAEVEEEGELGEEVGESGYLLVVNGVPTDDSPVDGAPPASDSASDSESATIAGDESDPEAPLWDPSSPDWLLDPEPDPWGDPNRAAVPAGGAQHHSD